ncbi:hypothetical protein [Marinifilum sp.]|uniref:hypothetical protein n=1 Tax=Marinifilum sp. TaxID=2033137 RepID=UPI003BAD50BD
MREICVPIPFVDDNQMAEVEVKFANRNVRVQFRLESFVWDVSDDSDFNPDDSITERLMKIYKLKKSISDYDPAWELIQIFTPPENSKYIQVLFRKK